MHQSNNFFTKKSFLFVPSLLYYCLLVSLNYSVACKNPNEYEPHFDSLYPPPAAPNLIFPPNDTVIIFYEPFPNNIALEWRSVDGAESYQLQIVNDTTQFFNAPIIKATDALAIFTVTKKNYYFWRVRAYSSKWEWFTDWSETWHFYAYYEDAQ